MHEVCVNSHSELNIFKINTTFLNHREVFDLNQASKINKGNSLNFKPKSKIKSQIELPDFKMHISQI